MKSLLQLIPLSCFFLGSLRFWCVFNFAVKPNVAQKNYEFSLLLIMNRKEIAFQMRLFVVRRLISVGKKLPFLLLFCLVFIINFENLMEIHNNKTFQLRNKSAQKNACKVNLIYSFLVSCLIWLPIICFYRSVTRSCLLSFEHLVFHKMNNIFLFFRRISYWNGPENQVKIYVYEPT